MQKIRTNIIYAFKDTRNGDLWGADKNSFNKDKFYSTRNGAEKYLQKRLDKPYGTPTDKELVRNLVVVELHIKEVK